MKSEVTSLKLEIATLTSALRELQDQQAGRRMTTPAKAVSTEPRPSIIPGAIVVLVSAGLLSWQVIATPHAGRVSVQAELPALPAIDRVTPLLLPTPVEVPAEPALAPIVKPTIYRGTLAVKSDRPGSTVFVNRRAVGTAPVHVGNLRAGSHLVWVESDGYRRWSRVVTVPARTITRVTADLEPEPVVEP